MCVPTYAAMKRWMRHTQHVNVVPALDLPRQLDQTDCFQAKKKNSQHEQSGMHGALCVWPLELDYISLCMYVHMCACVFVPMAEFRHSTMA